MQSSSPRDPTLPAPWGYWTTLGWTVLAITVSMFVAQYVLISQNMDAAVNFDGPAIAISVLVSMPVQVVILVLATQLAYWPSAAYLGIVWPERREIIVGLAGVVILAAATDGLFFLFGERGAPKIQITMYQDARAGGWLIWWLIATVVVAPICEEIMFRGFLFRGWVQTRASAPYAITAIALVWSFTHTQYNLLEMFAVFAGGILLGWMRWRSGSTLLTMMMHAAINIGAMVETAIQIK